MARALHPVGWWGWAIGLAVAAGLTTNPVLLALLLAVITLVVVSRRGDSPWARAYRYYVIFGVVVVLLRIVFHVLVGLKYGDHLLVPLPSVSLPQWAAGVQLFGPLYLEGLLGAVLEGLRLATMLIAIGAANALANPKRLLRSFPRALHEVGTAVVVGVSVAPQLAESVQRVYRARQLRGETGRGVRVIPRVALPVLQDTLERSLLLASAMESRGYGSRTGGERPWWVPALTFGGLIAMSWGIFGVLGPGGTPGSTTVMGAPMLAAGVVLSLAGLWAGGRQVRVSRYRPDPWRWPETLTVASGLAAAAAMLWCRATVPVILEMPLQPLAAPVLPLVALLGIAVAALPAVATPPLPREARPEVAG